MTPKGEPPMTVICKPKGLYFAHHLLLLLNQSIIQPILLLYSFTWFFDMSSFTNSAKLTHMTSTAFRIIGLPTPNLTEQNKAIACDLNNTRHHTPTQSSPYPNTLPGLLCCYSELLYELFSDMYSVNERNFLLGTIKSNAHQEQ